MQCVGDGRSRYLFDASITYSQNLMCDNYYNEDVMRRPRKDTCTWKNICEKMKYAQPGKSYAQFVRHCASLDSSGLGTVT